MIYSLLSIFAGILAGLFYEVLLLHLICTLIGMLGLGAGMIKGPLLLEIGVDPVSTAATSSFMIVMLTIKANPNLFCS